MVCEAFSFVEEGAFPGYALYWRLWGDVHLVPRTVRDLQARRPGLVLNDFV